MAGGQALTSGQGSVTGGQPLTGSSITGGTGLVDPSTPTLEAITGSAASTATGTQDPGTVIRLRSRKVGGGAASFLLSGSFATVQQETPAKQVSALLTTPSISSAQGSLSKSSSMLLSGQSLSSAQQPIGSQPTGFTITRTGATYSTLSAAITAAIAGDTIVGAPGTYSETSITVSKNLTIRCSEVNGNKVVIASPTDNSIIRVGVGVSMTLEDFHLKDNKSITGFQAGITTNGNTGTITLRRVKIEECNNGILNANTDFTCNLVMEDCEVLNNGVNVGEAATHQLYIGAIASLTMTGCWIHVDKGPNAYNALYGPGNEWRMGLGHLVKSRARITTIRACRITCENNGDSVPYGISKNFDISNGGDLTIEGCLVEYNTYRDQAAIQFVNWGPEGSGNLPGGVFEGDRTFKIKIRQNTFVTRAPDIVADSNKYWARWFVGEVGAVNGGTQPIPAPSEYSVIDNVFCGFDSNIPVVLSEFGSSAPSVTYAVNLTTNTSGATSLLTSVSTYDYTPVTPVTGSQNWATQAYVHPTSRIARTDALRGGVPDQLPSWLPAAGTWTQVGQSTGNGANVDASVKGDFPGFPSTRFLGAGGSGMSDDFIGAIWNPNYGTHGAWCLHGGGHSAGYKAGMLDVSMYVWDTTDRRWHRISDPVRPGDLSLSVYDTYYETNAEIPTSGGEPLKTYGALAVNDAQWGYVPSASHVRWLPVYVPPGQWGTGAQGGYFLPRLSAFHQGGATGAAYAYLFDFSSRRWSRVSNEDANDNRASGACIDGSGNIYKRGRDGVTRLLHNSSNWTLFRSLAMEFGPIACSPNDGLLLMLSLVGGSPTFQVIQISNPATVYTPGMNGVTPPYAGAPIDYYPTNGLIWCEELNSCIVFFPSNMKAYRLQKPASPLTQPWTWSLLTQSNSPSITKYANFNGFYNSCTYSRTLKSLMFSYDIEQDKMWCLRLSEIP